jgi:DNA topoisomerase-1
MSTTQDNATIEASRKQARSVGLQYINDQEHWIRRRKRGSGFEYVDANGRVIRRGEVVKRATALVIPPAWEDVRICPSPRGHLQAIGRDSRGRKQYRYHDLWNEAREYEKCNHLIDFAKVLPRIRRRVAKDLKRPGLCRERVMATIVRLLECTLIRVGNEEYARTNNSFGLTTIRNRHVRIQGSQLTFSFTGKSGKRHEVRLHDQHLAKLVAHCKNLPGKDVFQYVDENGVRDVTSANVNEYLRSIANIDVTAKDFRTWAATVMAVQLLGKGENCQSLAMAKRQLVGVIDEVAAQLGNTRSVCRKSYIHASVQDAFLDQTLIPFLTKERCKCKSNGLRAEENLLVRWLTRQGRSTKKPRVKPR